jgi:hypothetical protein
VERHSAKLDSDLAWPSGAHEPQEAAVADIDPTQPTAVILVGPFSGIGVHTLLHVVRSFPHYFRNFVFVSVGVIDSGTFKGSGEIEALASTTEAGLRKYVEFSSRLNLPAAYRFSIGTEVVSEAEKLCLAVREEFSRCVFFAGQLIFRRERWYQRLLHNQTAFAIQKRLQWHDLTMVVLPVRVRGRP